MDLHVSRLGDEVGISYGLAVALLADARPKSDIRSLQPNLLTNGRSQQEQPLEISPAIATAITDYVFLGAEIRHVTRNQDGFFTGHALFIGPSVFVKISDDISFKVAWSAQIPDETTGHLDPVNFERHQVIAVLVKGF